MRKIKVVVLLVQQLQHGFTKNAKVSPNLTVAHIVDPTDCYIALVLTLSYNHYMALHKEQQFLFSPAGGATFGFIYLCETLWWLNHHLPMCALHILKTLQTYAMTP